METVYLVFSVLAAFLLYLLFTYNSFVRLRNQVFNSFSGIDVQLKKRNDVLPNLVTIVQSYAKHEQSLFQSIAKTRSEVYSCLEKKDISTLSSQDMALSKHVTSLFAVAEGYPELQASQQFLSLQKQLVHLENQIAASRRIYNSNVTLFNSQLQIFPNNVLNKLFGFQEQNLYVLEDQS